MSPCMQYSVHVIRNYAKFDIDDGVDCLHAACVRCDDMCHSIVAVTGEYQRITPRDIRPVPGDVLRRRRREHANDRDARVCSEAVGSNVLHAQSRYRRRPFYRQSTVQGSQHAHGTMGIRRRRLQNTQRLL